MLTGFEKIVEERIKKAQRKGAFDNLEGSGKPLQLPDDHGIPEELRLAYKILKNAGFVPPEIEIKKEIRRTEDLLRDMKDTRSKYRILKKLNFMIMKLNTIRNAPIALDHHQHYLERLVPYCTNLYFFYVYMAYMYTIQAPQTDRHICLRSDYFCGGISFVCLSQIFLHIPTDFKPF